MYDQKNLTEVWLIINNKIARKIIPKKLIREKNGLKYYFDPYGMGAVEWPIIDSPEDEPQRRRIEKVIWAKHRLEWAEAELKKHKEEVKSYEEEIRNALRILEENG